MLSSKIIKNFTTVTAEHYTMESHSGCFFKGQALCNCSGRIPMKLACVTATWYWHQPCMPCPLLVIVVFILETTLFYLCGLDGTDVPFGWNCLPQEWACDHGLTNKNTASSWSWLVQEEWANGPKTANENPTSDLCSFLLVLLSWQEIGLELFGVTNGGNPA